MSQVSAERGSATLAEGEAPAPGACRFCGAPLEDVFVDLGSSPLANSYLPPERVGGMEPFYPLRALVCGRCFLVQLEEFETPAEIFSEYAYFSSYSTSWLEHCRRYAEGMTELLGLGEHSRVVELASNDGYLLQYFHERRIPVLGVEPAANVAKVALAEGHPHAGRVLRPRDGAVAGRGVPRRPAGGQQRPRPRARPQRLRGRHEDPARARRDDHA